MKAAIDTDKHWYVVRTTVKGEEKACVNIRKAGFDTYFPRRRVEVQHRRTKTYVVKEQPLMPRYLFVGFAPRNVNFYAVRESDGVECILGVDGRPILIPSKDVEKIFLAEVDLKFDDTKAARIHRKEEAKTEKETTLMRYPAGASVFVTDLVSPFATFGGIVDEVTKAGRIIALIDLFGRLTPVEFEPRQLSPVS
ncbi:Transcription antitermination factor NusG [Phyllobacterium sp. CL33Tsu]|uniref:transcription termination/antitermination protein NusG n=1 Tax=Phyllobacterium sp. CL33Tsu TaxID=1798191 RepID=UPI0008EC747F|nr:transcription termination/antitermination NusG family protein [Phyllobacterium sp. CL33Tsu]SFJ54739.1 Transcription antitermination factor NusG [Phyllobacterium sp. CL33Tsu]